MNVNELIGKRALLKFNTTAYRDIAVSEYRILESSPSGNWVKLMNTDGYKFWKPITEVSLVEVLKTIEKAPN